jgi:predicted nucleotidyltransferase
MRQSPDFEKLLAALSEHDVRFIVVGGVAAVLQGAPLATFDLDIVHQRTPHNVEALLLALADLEAQYRSHPRIEFTAETLMGPGHQLTLTEHGPLDILGAIGDDESYDDLLSHSEVFEIGEMSIRVLDLDGLIEQKTKTGREKDKAALPILQRALRERSGPDSDSE